MAAKSKMAGIFIKCTLNRGDQTWVVRDQRIARKHCMQSKTLEAEFLFRTRSQKLGDDFAELHAKFRSRCQTEAESGEDREISTSSYKIVSARRIQLKIVLGQLDKCPSSHIFLSSLLRLLIWRINMTWSLSAPGARIWTPKLKKC